MNIKRILTSEIKYDKTKEKGFLLVTENRNKVALGSVVNEGDNKFTVEINENNYSKHYLRSKIKELLINEFENVSKYKISFDNLMNTDLIVSDAEAGMNLHKGQVYEFQSHVNNYFRDGVLECSPMVLSPIIKVQYLGNERDKCDGATNYQEYSKFLKLQQ